MLRRLLRRYRTTNILASVVLGACVAIPLPGHATICGLRHSCTYVAPPPLSKSVAIQAVQGYLEQHPPVVRFRLQKPIGAHASAGYTDLARAGLLRVVSGTAGQGSGPVYGLPENWERDILSGVFRFAQVQTGDDIAYFIEIPVGQFRYVPGSAVLTLPDAHTALRPTVTFKYQFISNAKAARLLRLGPPKDWTFIDPTGAQLDLRRIGIVVKQTLPFRACHAGWYLSQLPFSCP